MNEQDFRKRVYANPSDLDQEILDAANSNPALQKILEEILEFNTEVSTAINAVPIPVDLAERLLSIPANADINLTEASKPASNNFFQYYALAASLLLALGIGVVINSGSNPSAAEVVFGNEVINHLYHEVNEINAINSGSDVSEIAMPAVIEVMASADTQFNDEEFLQSTAVKFAKPCVVLPEYHSAHLMIEGSSGTVNIIVIDNSPVTNEYSIKDDRFAGVVIPMDDGNLILIGEKNENLDQYKSMLSQNIEWII